MFLIKRGDIKKYGRQLLRNLGLPQGVKSTTILSRTPGMEHPAVDLTRNNKGSRWKPNSFNELIPADQWRYNYNPDTGIFEGRTIMGQWTNEVLDPRDMTTANWGGTATVTRNQVGIDGEANTACLVEDTNGTGGLFRAQEKTIADDNATHQLGLIVEKDNDTSRFPLISFQALGGTTVVSNQIYFNTSDGSKQLRQGSDTFEIKDNGDFWIIWGTVTNNTSGNITLRNQVYPAWTDTFGSDSFTTGSTILDVASIFLNRSSPPPTPVYGEVAGQSYTQDPDIATVTDLDAINFNPDEGTFVVELDKQADNKSSMLFRIDDSTFNEVIYVIQNSVGKLNFYIRNNGANESFISATYSSGRNRLAVSYSQDKAVMALNGSIIGSTPSISLPTLTSMKIGNSVSTDFFDGFIATLKYYPRQLTDAQHIQESTL